MSADNSIARGGREVDQSGDRAGFEIPPDLADRYDVRVVDGSHGDQRIGLFSPGNRDVPAIEITGDRIVARREDAETIESLVKIAQHNGWDRIAVDGSAEFRKAVWAAATREGLAVSGYEPSFVEQERAERARKDAAARGEQDAAVTTSRGAQPEPSGAPGPDGRSEAAQRGSNAEPAALSYEGPLSDDDRRLLLTLSRHTEDRRDLYGKLRPDMDVFDREVQYERIDANRAALDGALERVLESSTLVRAFERSGYEPESLRAAGKGGDWDGDVADAIYLVRSSLHRDTLAEGAAAAATLADEIDSDRKDRAVAEGTAAASGPPAGRSAVQDEKARDGGADRRHEGEELAELFLHGGSDRIAAEPRLAGALRAQTAMEQHIGEVFNGDGPSVSSASFESRQMISDALRRGLDVSVREPTPVRQIEPPQSRPDLER